MTGDDTPFGRGGDWCPWCGADWKRPHREECQARPACEFPLGCTAEALPGRVLCGPHLDDVSALFGDKVFTLHRADGYQVLTGDPGRAAHFIAEGYVLAAS